MSKSLRQKLVWIASPEIHGLDRLRVILKKLTWLVSNNKPRPQFTLSYPLVMKTPYGLKVKINDAFMYGMFTGGYEPEITTILDKMQDDDVFIDVGANLGVYSMMAAAKSRHGQVISIEANKRFYDYLSENIRRNNLKNITALHYAIWNTNDEELTIYQTQDNISKQYNATLFGSEQGNVVNASKVRTRTLDSIIEEFGCKRVDWLKIDIEGAESRALQGAVKTLEKTRNVLIEIHSEQNGHDCERVLKETGFATRILHRARPDYYQLYGSKK